MLVLSNVGHRAVADGIFDALSSGMVLKGVGSRLSIYHENQRKGIGSRELKEHCSQFRLASLCAAVDKLSPTKLLYTVSLAL